MSLPAPETFLSGEVGHVGRRRPALRAADRLLDAAARLRGVPRRLDRLAAELPPRRVVVVSVYRPGSRCIAAVASELRTSRHEVVLGFGSTGEPLPDLAGATVASRLPGGKFQNLNAVLERTDPSGADWVLVVDDDVRLPERFLDRLLAVCEHFDLRLAQPALTLASHGAWRVTRRRGRPLARETRFVEIGPVTLLSREVAAELIPFPDLRYGWGLDLHWSALAEERGWRRGVVDCLPVRHELAGVGSAYPQDDAVAEAQRFLAERDFLPAAQANETVRVLA